MGLKFQTCINCFNLWCSTLRRHPWWEAQRISHQPTYMTIFNNLCKTQHTETYSKQSNSLYWSWTVINYWLVYVLHFAFGPCGVLLISSILLKTPIWPSTPPLQVKATNISEGWVSCGTLTCEAHCFTPYQAKSVFPKTSNIVFYLCSSASQA